MNVGNNITDAMIQYDELRLDKVSETVLRMHEDSWIEWFWNGTLTNPPKKSKSDKAYITAIVGVNKISFYLNIHGLLVILSTKL